LFLEKWDSFSSHRIIRFIAALTHGFMRRSGDASLLEQQQTILNFSPQQAFGSSSTAGAGASSLDHSYPSQLAVEFQRLFPGHPIAVLNRGVNGEEASDMLARIDRTVLAEKPDLVLWQVGTDEVLRDSDLQPVGAAIHEGLARLKASGADVVLIDPQFVPGTIAKAEIKGMVSLIADLARQEDVDLFSRFAIMQNWREASGIPFNSFVSPDDVHMNDWGYGCVAKILAHTIADAVSRPILSAATSHAIPIARQN
jgi:acyl-CoA thioesterase-1